MLRKLLLGFASVAVASVASGLIVVVIDPVTSAGAHGSNIIPSVINRALKGDRLQTDQLPMHMASHPHSQSADIGRPGSPAAAAPVKLVPKKAPFGCDPSFSPVVSPSLADIFGRCTT
jgi:hypothetical protein